MKRISILLFTSLFCSSIVSCSPTDDQKMISTITAPVSEVQTKAIDYESQKVLLQYTVPIIDDETFKLSYLEEGIISRFFVFSVKDQWAVYSNVDISITWYDALGGIVSVEDTHLDYVSGNCEYLLKSPKSMYRYLSVKVMSHGVEDVIANVVHSGITIDDNKEIVSDYFVLSADHTSEATVKFSSAKKQQIYVNLVRNGVVVDSAWVTNGTEVETYRNIDYIVPFIVQK